MTLVPVEECDVENRRALVEFRLKFEEWSSWLWSDEYHAIERQVSRLMYGDMAYRVLIEARLRTEAKQAGAAENALLASFLDQSHVEAQVLAIGRLIDRSKDVLSLCRLLDDMHAHCHLFTREIFVAHDGRPYDVVRSFGRHLEFDKLFGVSSAGRSRLAHIRCTIFKTVGDLLKEVDDDGLRKLRNKFIAHAANLRSRGSERYTGPSAELLEKMTNAQKHIVRALQLICRILPRFEKLDVTPHPPLGFLNGLDRQFSCISILELQKKWKDLTKERNEWQCLEF